MDREEAIRILDPETTAEALSKIDSYNGCIGRTAAVQAVSDACVLAVSALREQEERDNRIESDAVKNDPLTLHELRQMKDEPVYLKLFNPLLTSGWYIIKAVTSDKIIYRGWKSVFTPINGLGVDYNLYRHKLKEDAK